MGSITIWMTYWYVTLAVAIAMPFMEPFVTKDSVEKVKDECNSRALRTVLAQVNALETEDTLLKHASNFGNTGTLFDSKNRRALTNSAIGILLEELQMFPEMTSSLEIPESVEVLFDLLMEFKRIRNECILKFVNENNLEVQGDVSTANDERSLSESGQQSLGQLMEFSNEGSKRAGLALNPTGWRKRRSTPRTVQDLERLLENMRKVLMEKRQRLPVHATGW